ncbi:hypothetical protein EIN_263680 [Entamoeba invadens IP1]|uniref:TLDc domain-containing protein n=1 Tax=Entamoeba invadens IP1 TaxID=370355 RepID=L7FP42_ENTIV|nr:hypothetical protein EIN_263680 [Entamoeba invadens IP1]ELP92964.1 hypothetical protein EIN_263680 [Entamoeba invadens IP1]|eukprot:XP_004259735.1 hypothetical protein EIN_263680 [Entamoeba invadens IP1]
MSSVDKNVKLSCSEKSQQQLGEDENFLSVEEKAKLVVWSGRQHMKAVFDSEVDCMGRGSAKFYKTISRCDGVVIVIDSTNGCRFGVFVAAKVEKNGEYITDENAFVFLLRDNGKEKMRNFYQRKERGVLCWCFEFKLFVHSR